MSAHQVIFCPYAVGIIYVPMLFNLFLLPSFIILFFLNPLKNLQRDCLNVSINGAKSKMEVANTNYKRALGLMYRDFNTTSGMIFIYKNPTNPIYYNSNVRFPVRIYFIDSNFNTLATSVMQKKSFKFVSPNYPIKYVVEVPLQEDFSNDPGELVEIKIENL